ncbi:MAG: CoA transferase, partial [Pseudomonadota bacterium]|nr:CoA transferase [Pseudomonadota bacterium]
IGWVEHPSVPGGLPLPNLIGAGPFHDASPLARAPGLGEHGADILGEHGYGRTEIADLIARRVVGRPG